MHFNKFYSDIFYLFITNIDQQIFKNILKFKGIVIVYNQSSITDLSQFIKIKTFCRKKNIKFFILDNYKLALKFGLDGLVLSHRNKTYSHSKLIHKKILLLLARYITKMTIMLNIIKIVLKLFYLQFLKMINIVIINC